MMMMTANPCKSSLDDVREAHARFPAKTQLHASAATVRDAQAEGAAAAGCERPAWRGEVLKKGGCFDLGERW